MRQERFFALLNAALLLVGVMSQAAGALNVLKKFQKLKSENEEESISQSCDGQSHETCVARDPQQYRDRLLEFVKSLIDHLRDNTIETETEDEAVVSLEMSLTPKILSELQKFTDAGPIQDAYSVLVDTMHFVNPRRSRFALVAELFMPHVCEICLVATTLATLSIAIFMQHRYRESWWSWFGKLLIIILLLSFLWNFLHLYKMESAKRYAAMLKEMPSDCKPNHQQSWWEGFVNLFSFDVDACTKYHQRMMIDPIWEVPPTKVLAVTFTKFAMEPLEHIGHAFNMFLQKTLHGLPVYLWPVAIFVVILTLLLPMVMAFGYRLNLFYVFIIEPGRNRVGLFEQQLQDEINRLQQQLQETQRALSESHRAEDTTALPDADVPGSQVLQLNLFYVFIIEPGRNRVGLFEQQLQDEINRLQQQLQETQRALSESHRAEDTTALPDADVPGSQRQVQTIRENRSVSTQPIAASSATLRNSQARGMQEVRRSSSVI